MVLQIHSAFRKNEPMAIPSDIHFLVDKCEARIEALELSGEEQEEYSTMLCWLEDQIDRKEPGLENRGGVRDLSRSLRDPCRLRPTLDLRGSTLPRPWNAWPSIGYPAVMFPRMYLALSLFVLASPAVSEQRTPGVFDLAADREPMVVMNEMWRFHTGDNMRWAEPGFNDSGWQLLKGEGGWGSQGYKGYSGYAWYRARVVIPAHAPQILLYVQMRSIRTGVVEARDAAGELVGFDRTRALSSCPAGEIAAAAKEYGQDDDITVLTLRRLASVVAI